MPGTGLPGLRVITFECSDNGNFGLLPNVILQMAIMADGITSKVDLLCYAMGCLFHHISDEYDS